MEVLGVLSSALAVAALSAVVTIYVSKLSYKQKYYEKIVERRLQAYEEISGFIGSLKTTIHESVGEDRRPYHSVFSYGFDDFVIATHGALSDTVKFWISNSTNKAILDLNKEFYRCSLLYRELDGDLIEVGRREYQEVARLRDILENASNHELLGLHDVPKFLKNRSIETVFTKYDLKQRPSQ
jgi:hypothetical protein